MKETNRINIKVDLGKNILNVDTKNNLSRMELINIIGLLMSEYNMIMMTRGDMESVNFLLDDKDAVIDRIIELGQVELNVVEYKMNTFCKANHYIYEIEEKNGLGILDITCILSIVGSYLSDTMMDSFAVDKRLKRLDSQEAIEEIGNLRKTLEINMNLMQIYGMMGCTYKDERVLDLNYIDSLVDKLAMTIEIGQDMLDNLEEDLDDEEMKELDRSRYYLAENTKDGKNHSHYHEHWMKFGHDDKKPKS